MPDIRRSYQADPHQIIYSRRKHLRLYTPNLDSLVQIIIYRLLSNIVVFSAIINMGIIMDGDYNDYDPDLIPTPEFQLLQNLIKPPYASPEEAVQQVIELTKAEALSRKWPENKIRGDFTWNISHLALDIATNTKPENQLNLLDFLKKLQKIAVMDPRTGEQLMHDHEKLWTELPCVGYYSCDLQDFCKY